MAQTAGSGGSGATSGAGGQGGGNGGTGDAQGGSSTGGTPVIPTEPEGGAGGEVTCGEERYAAEPRPLAMQILVDQSSSMTRTDDRWTPVAGALRAFVDDEGSSGIVVSVGFFPLADEAGVLRCEVADYSLPEVPLAALPGNAPAVHAAFDARSYVAGDAPAERNATPTRPALEGSFAYLSSFLEDNPEHTGVLVLATDGDPTECTPNAVRDVVATLAAAAEATRPMVTYVIGIGDLEHLADFAEAGSTGHDAFVVDGTGANTRDEFLAAINQIRGTALPCAFSIPEPTSGEADFAKLNVDYTPDGADDPLPFYNVETLAECVNTSNSWYYEESDGERSVRLCPTTCDDVKAVGFGSVSITLGCTTRIR